MDIDSVRYAHHVDDTDSIPYVDCQSLVDHDVFSDMHAHGHGDDFGHSQYSHSDVDPDGFVDPDLHVHGDFDLYRNFHRHPHFDAGDILLSSRTQNAFRFRDVAVGIHSRYVASSTQGVHQQFQDAEALFVGPQNPSGSV
jgi:hypothetical protein